MLKHNWSKDEALRIYQQSFPDLVFQAQTIHRENFPANTVQRSTLLSVKTGGCPEDCAYCPQSAHYQTGVEREEVLSTEIVLAQAKKAKNEGSPRFCMGAAWREVKDGKEFDQVIDLVSNVSNLGMEVCCTLGMLNADQAERLKEAGCHAYNHNLDTSPEYYGDIISTRTYEQRLQTLKNVRDAGITVCCGGSVPINMLVKVEGTPLAEEEAGEVDIDPIDFVRMIATARIMMPKSYVRLSAGRMEMSDEMQALCFVAGANSMFAGDKLLTTPNPEDDADRKLMKKLGMNYQEESATEKNSTSANQNASCCNKESKQPVQANV